MLQKFLLLSAMVPLALLCQAQEKPPHNSPQVKVNMLNVCSPSAEDRQEISSALARIPQRPSFSPDFEIDRGRSVLDPSSTNLIATAAPAQMPSEETSAQFVRIRHDFPPGAMFSNVQYSFSRDTGQMVETLVFRVRDPKELLEVSIESSASSVTTAAAMLAAATPAGRVKLERFGKSSVVLARCSGQNAGPAPDQSAYEPLFASASSVLSDYRDLLGARTLVPEELGRMSGSGKRPARNSSRGH